MSGSVEALFNGYFFDWYQVTLDTDDVDTLVKLALDNWGFSDVVQVKPRVSPYMRAYEVRRGDRCIFHVCCGGHNPGLHLVASGSISQEVATWLQVNYKNQYSVTRADVRLDTVTEGVWDYLYKVCSAFAIENKITSNQVGDYLTAVKGRTLYLGSPSSVVQVRLYEKGKKEGGNKNWVRLEIQVRPSKSDAKRKASSYEPSQFWGSSKWAWKLLNKIHIGTSVQVAPSLGTVWRATDDQRATSALVKQYYPLMCRLQESLPPGMDLFVYLTKWREEMQKVGNQSSGFGDDSWQDAVLVRALYEG